MIKKSVNKKRKPVAPPPKIGRPSKFDPEFVKRAKLYAEHGATDADISRFLGISTQTLWEWKIHHPDFASALKIGKDVADQRVEQSLYHRAIGYSHDAVKIFANPKTGENVKVDYIEHYPPDTTAAIFWLKNRRKDEWRDRGANDPGEFDPEEMSTQRTPVDISKADEPGPKNPIL